MASWWSTRSRADQGVISQRDQFGELFYARRDEPALTRVDLPPHEVWITETSGLLEAFVDAVVEEQPLPCSGRDHLRSLAMIDACVRSSREGCGVAVANRLADVTSARG
jgi:predicted dehydrogenase